MNEQIRELITKLLNPKGRLDCGAAFKIAAKLGVEVGLVSDEAEKMGVKIDNCELGQFGGLDKDRGKFTLSLKLKEVSDENLLRFIPVETEYDCPFFPAYRVCRLALKGRMLFLVIILMTPPIALLSYNVEAAPRTTSIRSMSLMLNRL